MAFVRCLRIAKRCSFLLKAGNFRILYFTENAPKAKLKGIVKINSRKAIIDIIDIKRGLISRSRYLETLVKNALEAQK